MSKKTSKSEQAVSVLVAGSVSLNAFWVFTILAESYKAFHDLFNVYDPIGALLGVFLASLLMFVLAMFGTQKYLSTNKVNLKKVETNVINAYVVSIVLFFFMVFPAFFSPIVDVIS